MLPLGNLNINDHKGKGLYARPKTSADVEFEQERAKLTRNSANSGEQSGFANPVHNVQQFGLQEGMQVADLGSGAGHYTLAMANVVGSSGKVYAVDVQKDLLGNVKSEAEKRGFDNVEIVWGDIEKLGGTKIADSMLSLALISNTLFQVENKPALLHEAARILKSAGTLVVIDWSESFGGMGPIAGNVVSKEAALSMCASAGFTLTTEFEAGAHHYGILFSKN